MPAHRYGNLIFAVFMFCSLSLIVWGGASFKVERSLPAAQTVRP